MYDGKTLYYMTAMDNIPNISVYGILTRNELEGSVLYDESRSVDDRSVNSRRGDIEAFGKSLHDYVPLYWATHTPMQYVITRATDRITDNELVFIVLRADLVSILNPIVTTDGNAANDDTSFYEGWGAVPYLDESILNCRKCLSKEYKRKKSAEVLVGRTIPPALIEYFAVKSEAAKMAAKKLVAPGSSPIRVGPEFYF
jgi:hypothetical protein